MAYHEYVKVELSDRVRENYKRLANHLLSLDDGYRGFSMGTYCHDRNQPGDPELDPNEVYEAWVSECATVACALGHGPLAGVEATEVDWDWLTYYRHHFSPDERHPEPVVQESRESQAVWNWCFCSEWEEFDNTPQGAGRRINLMLNEGIPVTFSISGMRSGRQGSEQATTPYVLPKY